MSRVQDGIMAQSFCLNCKKADTDRLHWTEFADNADIEIASYEGNELVTDVLSSKTLDLV